MVITSPGTTGLSCVTSDPGIFAQQVAELSSGDNVIVALVLTDAEIAMLLPAGPPTLAVRTMRVNSPAGVAVTISFALALMRAIRPSRTACNVSVDCTT